MRERERETCRWVRVGCASGERKRWRRREEKNEKGRCGSDAGAATWREEEGKERERGEEGDEGESAEENRGRRDGERMREREGDMEREGGSNGNIEIERERSEWVRDD